MTATAATLRARFPEYAATPDAVVTAALAEATRRTSAAVFSAADVFDDAVTLRACHLLALSPGGHHARLEGAAVTSPSFLAADLGRTTYGASLLALMRERAGGPHMLGCGPLA